MSKREELLPGAYREPSLRVQAVALRAARETPLYPTVAETRRARELIEELGITQSQPWIKP